VFVRVYRMKYLNQIENRWREKIDNRFECIQISLDALNTFTHTHQRVRTLTLLNHYIYYRYVYMIHNTGAAYLYYTHDVYNIINIITCVRFVECLLIWKNKTLLATTTSENGECFVKLFIITVEFVD
jgi:hypothetical protein